MKEVAEDFFLHLGLKPVLHFVSASIQTGCFLKAAIVNKYVGKDYVLYAATFGDLDPDDYLVHKGQLDNLRDNRRRRGAGVRPSEVYIVDFD